MKNKTQNFYLLTFAAFMGGIILILSACGVDLK